MTRPLDNSGPHRQEDGEATVSKRSTPKLVGKLARKYGQRQRRHKSVNIRLLTNLMLASSLVTLLIFFLYAILR